MKKNRRLQALIEGALLVALAQILCYLKLWRMPWGGSVVLSMVPLVVYCVRWGLARGLLAGFVFGVLQFTFDGGFVLGWQSIVGDYLLAYVAVGFAGLFRGKSRGAAWGSLTGGFFRFLVHLVVGATVWGSYMPETFFGQTMTSPWQYSLLYNAAYMIPNIVLTMAVCALLYATPLKRYLLRQDMM